MENNKRIEPFDMERLMSKFDLSTDAIKVAGFSEDDLCALYDDYVGRCPLLEAYKNEFITNYILNAENIRFHSYSGRVKTPDHLLEKIIRKRNNKDSKYSNMQRGDYYKYVTDMIGCRILLVYKSDWIMVHNYLTEKFANKLEMYIDDKDYAASYRADVSDWYMAEKPRAYIRAGDDETAYNQANDVEINTNGYYRSVHYIIRYHEYYLEVQVRSLFEEAWGEVDHDVLYPLYKENAQLVQFSRILNRAAGLGDEMSTYFRDHVQMGEFKKSGSLYDTPDDGFTDASTTVTRIHGEIVPHQQKNPASCTPNEMIDDILLS